jgi:hypothetical protein
MDRVRYLRLTVAAAVAVALAAVVGMSLGRSSNEKAGRKLFGGLHSFRPGAVPLHRLEPRLLSDSSRKTIMIAVL